MAGEFVGALDEEAVSYKLTHLDPDGGVVWTETYDYESIGDFIDEGKAVGLVKHVKEWLDDSPVEEAWGYLNEFDDEGRLVESFKTNHDQPFTYTEWDDLGRPTAGTSQFDPYCADMPVTLEYDDAERTARKEVSFTGGVGEDCPDDDPITVETVDEYNFRVKRDEKYDGPWETKIEYTSVTETGEICK
jgi:hypothetical protein